ncbi:MAG: carbohydrate porin, partial [bacterium]
LRLRTNFFGKKGHHWFGYIYGDGNFTSQNQDARISFDRTGIDLTIERPVEDETWAFFYNFDQYLVTNPNDPEQGWGIFGRFGIADESTNFVRKFFSFGLGGTGLFPGRASDRFGIGYYYMELSDEVDLIPVHSDEQGIEIFYSVPLLPSTELTADVQILDGSFEAADTAVIGGIRLRMKF